MSHFVNKKPIGQILQQASLVSAAQIDVALYDSALHTASRLPDLKLGEILALRGWVKQQTVDFFVEQWPQLVLQPERKKIGFYLQEAGLLDTSQIEWIIQQQAQLSIKKKFGELACEQGWLKQNTIQFFIQQLSLENNSENSLISHPSLSTEEAISRYMIGDKNLQNSRLDKVQFGRLILEDVNLEGSQIREANLEACIFDHSNLKKTDLSKSNLVKASFYHTDLRYSSLKGCNLHQAFLAQANLIGVNLKNSDLTEANLQNAQLDHALLQGADLRGANLAGASLRRAYYDKTTRFDADIDPLALEMQLADVTITSIYGSIEIATTHTKKKNMIHFRDTLVLSE
ncbi:MAG TPA: pentapeptide repeat-containing protein [Xenococcaceae cyanobacterium]|jgi:uncharacterized protein YjbI with pentapeptide repeats